MSVSETRTLAVGDEVRVFNPRPMAGRGVILEGPRRKHDTFDWVRVQWDDGDTTWSRADLLRRIENG